jgi:hypothetical protein
VRGDRRDNRGSGDLVEDEVGDGKDERPPADEAGEADPVAVRVRGVRPVVVPVDEPGREGNLNSAEKDDEAKDDWKKKEEENVSGARFAR